MTVQTGNRWVSGARATIACLFVVCTAPSAEKPAHNLNEIFTGQLSAIVKEPAGWSATAHHSIGGLSFSPDQHWLAVTISHIESANRALVFQTHLLIFDLADLKKSARRIDLPNTCGVNVAWNQTGNAILTCGTIVNLADDHQCDAVSQIGMSIRTDRVQRVQWLDPEHVVRWNGPILDMNCNRTSVWELDRNSTLVEVSAADQLAVLIRDERFKHPTNGCGYSIVDLVSRNTIGGRTTLLPPCGFGQALVSAMSAFCRSSGENVSKSTLECVDVRSATKISVPKPFKKYVLEQVAATSSRVIAMRWTYPRFGFLTPPKAARRAVFDLRTGELISSWTPRMQHTMNAAYADLPYRVAISKDGKLIAESGDNDLEIYRTEH